MTHPSDNVALNIDVLFSPPVVEGDGKQSRVNAIVYAAKNFASVILDEIPDDSEDRRITMSCLRDACDRAVSAVVYETVTVTDPPLPPEF